MQTKLAAIKCLHWWSLVVCGGAPVRVIIYCSIHFFPIFPNVSISRFLIVKMIFRFHTVTFGVFLNIEAHFTSNGYSFSYLGPVAPEAVKVLCVFPTGVQTNDQLDGVNCCTEPEPYFLDG